MSNFCETDFIELPPVYLTVDKEQILPYINPDDPNDITGVLSSLYAVANVPIPRYKEFVISNTSETTTTNDLCGKSIKISIDYKKLQVICSVPFQVLIILDDTINSKITMEAEQNVFFGIKQELCYALAGQELDPLKENFDVEIILDGVELEPGQRRTNTGYSAVSFVPYDREKDPNGDGHYFFVAHPKARIIYVEQP